MIKIIEIDKDLIRIVSKEKKEYAYNGDVDIEIINDYLAYLKKLNVLEEYRNRGIGGILVKKVIEICKDKNIKKISCTVNFSNINSIKLFLKAGFRKEGILRNHFREDGTLLVMSKFL